MHRSWFPAILIGLSLILGIAFLSVTKDKDGRGLFTVRPAPGAREGVREEDYQSAVNGVLRVYSEDGDAKAAYDALILLRVPSSELTTHLDLVAAMGKLMSGDEADGKARLSALKAQHDWLAL